MTGKKNESYDLGLPDYDPEAWPQSVKHYRIDTSFTVVAHNEKQALLRWREFKAVLMHLFGNEWHAHEIVRYVVPDDFQFSPEQPTPPERLTLLGEQVEQEMPAGGMASGVMAEEAWLDPYSDDDFDPILAANRIFFAEAPDDEDIENHWAPLELTDEVGPDGVIRRIQK